ncbi:MAG: cell wall hydrolase [Clostridiales bacterium]|nr:cell wall hydrolase [Clostridiales bacterium]
MKNRRRNQIKTLFMIAVLGFILWFQSVEAAQQGFPLIAEDGESIHAGISIMEKEINGSVSQVDSGKGSASRTNTQETMENLNMYDDLTTIEKQILYKVVSMECDTGYEGSLAVISCMMNRTQSDKYSDDLMEVVTEDSQFTAYYDKETGTYPYVDREPSEECIAAVEDALYKGKRNIPSYILYFRSSDYTSLPGYKRYAQIGDNTYFYLDEDVE